MLRRPAPRLRFEPFMGFSRPLIASLLLSIFVPTATLAGQSNSGELRLKVTDPSGLGVRSEVALVSEASEFRKTLSTDDSGELMVKRLPFGVYHVKITGAGFTEFTDSVEVRSAVPFEYVARLTIAAPNTSVIVNDSDTLIDPRRIGDTKHLGAEAIAHRQRSLPSRSLQDLANSQRG